MHAEQVTEPVDRERDRSPLRWYVRLVLRYAGRGPYLEVGGDGRLLRRLAEHGPASGVAPSAGTAARIRAEAPGCPVHRLVDVPDGSFRCVVAIDALGRTDDPEQDLSDVREWRRVLVPGGRAIVLVPDAAGRGAELTGDAGAGARAVRRSHADWLRLFAEAGLSVQREGSDGLSRGPYGRIPTWLDPRRLPARVQQAFGSLYLSPGEGENSVFVLERPN
ncbi:class I SAM-dependent methyltransferase [Pseudonocardia sp. RS11V-5]|uniref:class I SAM-dependent methyltransferase n=1 Tax=Pseudonocardia terrae TaxID=2905831 RepID=UPI001E492C0C|nr:class I SAM-dependent methyltransferase [Pseudonocardia terrae]MCE3550373.1 class I SAM-dependent methyltransferase [Pseudonocardia terrae]